jgi:hypothetical protein
MTPTTISEAGYRDEPQTHRLPGGFGVFVRPSSRPTLGADLGGLADRLGLRLTVCRDPAPLDDYGTTFLKRFAARVGLPGPAVASSCRPGSPALGAGALATAGRGRERGGVDRRCGVGAGPAGSVRVDGGVAGLEHGPSDQQRGPAARGAGGGPGESVGGGVGMDLTGEIRLDFDATAAIAHSDQELAARTRKAHVRVPPVGNSRANGALAAPPGARSEPGASTTTNELRSMGINLMA